MVRSLDKIGAACTDVRETSGSTCTAVAAGDRKDIAKKDHSPTVQADPKWSTAATTVLSLAPARAKEAPGTIAGAKFCGDLTARMAEQNKKA
jgi:hypothetical protein